ncbi:MAG: M15 family metallopeptidase [Prevotellaceae bacterium]|jgi:D-alanyl-D-alanine dipeptidase|nr:M15 family metallopeptidase [Prevotellaceae bacterium]
MTDTLFFYILVFAATFVSCRQAVQPQRDIQPTAAHYTYLHEEPLAKDAELASLGLVDVTTLDEGIAVHLVYATPYNFLGKTLYRDLSRAYLQPDAAQKLLNAYKALKKIRPDLTLVIYDAARPVSIQHEMWDMVKGTDWNYYVANPTKGGGMHNFGAAVDLSLMDGAGQALAMGTPYDYFGVEANTDNEAELVKQGRITPRELENRLLLRKVMTDAGFRTVKSEWWHFNSCTLQEALKQYKLIE